MSLTDLSEISLEEDRPSFEKFDVPKNEKARILVPTTQAAIHYVHVFHSDTPEMVEFNGKMKPEWSRDSYAGSFICTGNAKTVAKNTRYGDPENCAACKAMHEGGPQLVEMPKKNYAINVIKYSTKQRDNLKLRSKNVEVLVWKHGDDKKIAPIITASKQTDISQVDFLVADDEGSIYKKWSVQPALDGALYTKDKELGDNVKAAMEELHDADTLTRACGRDLSKEELEAEVNMLFSQFNSANGGASAGGSTTTTKAAANTPADDDGEIVLDNEDDGDFSELEDIDIDAFGSLLDEDD